MIESYKEPRGGRITKVEEFVEKFEEALDRDGKGIGISLFLENGFRIFTDEIEIADELYFRNFGQLVAGVEVEAFEKKKITLVEGSLGPRFRIEEANNG